MPANKNAMTRYKILDDLLSCRYHNYSLDDLTEEVNKRLAELYPDTNGVGRRTIEKDIYYLEYEGPFLVEIERYSAPGYNREKQKSYNKRCLRYAKPSFSIFKKDLSDDELLKIAKELYEFDIEIDETEDINNAQVTRGGVDTKEVDNKTFMSKRIKNLYFIGEVLDIDGICGGYNLQFAYSSSKALSENL